MNTHPSKEFMEKAINEAKDSALNSLYAIGAVIVNAQGEVISIEHTTAFESNDATAHAEVNAIRTACKKLNSCYLPGCWLYTTLESCPMCTSAAIWAKMEGIVFGATKDDAINFFNNSKDNKFSWRQIDISSKDIIKKGNPVLQLHECFEREECIKLFSFANE